MKYLLILLFLFSTQSFADSNKVEPNPLSEFLDKEWYFIGVTEDGQTQAYFNQYELVKRDGKLFVWIMMSEKVRKSFGKSAKELIVTDCKKPITYEQLSLTFFEEEMGEGNIVKTFSKEALDKGLKYAVSNSIKEGVIERACNWKATR